VFDDLYCVCLVVTGLGLCSLGFLYCVFFCLALIFSVLAKRLADTSISDMTLDTLKLNSIKQSVNCGWCHMVIVSSSTDERTTVVVVGGGMSSASGVASRLRNYNQSVDPARCSTGLHHRLSHVPVNYHSRAIVTVVIIIVSDACF